MSISARGRGVSCGSVATLVLYDGVCGLCDRVVQFLLRRDTLDRLRFATLQGELGARYRRPAAADPEELATLVVVTNWPDPDSPVLTRSRAVLHAVAQLPPPWPAVARVAAVLPPLIADALYTAVARIRYRVFGRFESCPLPPPEWRRKFL